MNMLNPANNERMKGPRKLPQKIEFRDKAALKKRLESLTEEQKITSSPQGRTRIEYQIAIIQELFDHGEVVLSRFEMQLFKDKVSIDHQIFEEACHSVFNYIESSKQPN